MAPYYEKKFLIRLFRNFTVGRPRVVKYLFFKLEKAKIIKEGDAQTDSRNLKVSRVTM